MARQVHLQVWLAGPRGCGCVAPPRLLLGRLLHLLVVVVPAGSRAGVRRLSPGRIGPGRAWGGAVPSDLVPADVMYEAVAHVQTPAGLAAQPRAWIPCRLHPDIGRRGAATATTAAELKPPAAKPDFRLRTATSGSVARPSSGSSALDQRTSLDCRFETQTVSNASFLSSTITVACERFLSL